MALAEQFDFQVVNDDFATTFQEIQKIIDEMLAQG